MINHKDRSHQVHLWKAFPTGKNCKMASSTIWIWHTIRLSKSHKRKFYNRFSYWKNVRRFEPINFDFSDKDLMVVWHDEEENSEKNGWKLYFDRASNALGHGIRAVLVTSKGEYCSFTARRHFNCTNNVTEYETCVMGLQATINKRVKELEVYGDLTLVIY